MNVVYFAHSYRSQDAHVVRALGRLLRSEGLVPSLDPPSESVNAAKLERHLAATDGMVAILTVRDGGVSPHILYEIALCLRARKPLLVFVEDVLPAGTIPVRVLQRRFSRRSLLRQARELRHALQILRTYVGESPPPRYQPSLARRACLLLGEDALSSKAHAALAGVLEGRGYDLRSAASGFEAAPGDVEAQEAVLSADLTVCVLDTRAPQAYYAYGLVRGACIPTIALTAKRTFSFDARVPLEYQPRKLRTLDDTAALEDVLATEIDLYEEDFVELDRQDEVERYAALLLDMRSAAGEYRRETRNIFIDELVLRDKYVTEQAGAVGPGAQAHDIVFVQRWNEVADGIDLQVLTAELAELRARLRELATGPEHDRAIAEVASAEEAAAKGDGPRVLRHLAGAGRWALDAATAIGTTIASEALKTSLGL